MSSDLNIENASAEMSLLLRCMRSSCCDECAEVGAEIVAGTERGLNWDGFIRLARGHRCIPQVYESLVGCDAVSLSVMEQLKKLSIKIALCCVKMTEALCDIQEVLAGSGIGVACVKGPALSLLAYGNTTTRHFGDLDLVVADRDLGRTVELLLSEGYELRELSSQADLRSYLATGQSVTFQNRDRTLYLDVNAVLISSALSGPDMAEWVLASSSALPVDDRMAIQSPGPELMMIAVCMHGAEDMWHKLFTVADVSQLIRSHADIDWSAMLATAEAWGQKRSVLTGMAVAQKLLNTTLPAAVDQALKHDAVAARLADEAAQSLVAMTVPHAGLMRQKRFEYMTRERVGDRWRWLTQLLFVPSARDMNALVLPRCLAWLYYVLRPFRVLGRLAKEAGMNVKCRTEGGGKKGEE